MPLSINQNGNQLWHLKTHGRHREEILHAPNGVENGAKDSIDYERSLAFNESIVKDCNYKYGHFLFDSNNFLSTKPQCS